MFGDSAADSVSRLSPRFCFYFLLIFFLAGCRGEQPPDPDLEKGKILAQQYCASCHQLPEPALLNKNTWLNHVLPKMGGFLGLKHLDQDIYFSDNKPGTMPEQEWKKIVDYYMRSAPDSLPADSGSILSIAPDLAGFVVQPLRTGNPNAATTFAGIDSPSSRVLLADGLTGYVYAYDRSGNIADSFQTGTGPSKIVGDFGGLQVLVMGVMHPSDAWAGRLLLKRPGTERVEVVLDSLQRPVYAEFSDLNRDKRKDIIICEFGNYYGRLSWFENRDGGKYLRHILREMPGAVHAAVHDFNRDGLPDIMALMAQGDEGFFIYYQQADGKFREQRVLQLPPSYGSNYFELADFNGDGYADILATNGDNGDYPPLLKPYHGIRIYINDGHNRFRQTVFLPMHGAVKAMARDFDGDGDPDIASIAYFNDYLRGPGAGFLYWENEGENHFKPHTLEEGGWGHWLTMDAGDMDGDGRTDILLGSANLPLGGAPASFRKDWSERGLQGLVLLNRMGTGRPKP